jgi:DNA-binding ferritin-like protein
MKQLINSLQELQANLVVYSNLVKGFFLNTESVLMRQSRITYEEIYIKSDKSLMDVSVWLRRLGGESPYTLEEFSKNHTMGNVKPDTYCGVEMAVHLVPINKKLIEDIRIVIDQAIINKEYALVQKLSLILEQHQEWNWFLESSLKLPPNPWQSLKD